MRSIETTATVTPDGTLMAQMPSDIEPGQHRVVVVLEEATTEDRAHGPQPSLGLQASAWSGFPADCTFRREDMYGDDGR